MNDKKQKYLEQLLMTIEVQNRIITDSKNFDSATKEAFINLSNQIKELTKSKLTKVQMKSLSIELLTFWKESIGPEVEMFWTELKDIGVDFERRDELNFALQKERFRRVDQEIAARKHWNTIKVLGTISDRFSSSELTRISKIIEKDENTRLEILKKCLRKNSIPQTQYYKFGECMAYFGQCELFDSYFNKKEVNQLYEIWRNFKSE
ncbi:hypothetical protein FF125_04555 [Aureibaculum algae]|uniref:Uncharacterized protein n=1 Tax=Aureibaculum algae TaxID=2584122 RepID=A0A5B7TLW6_9FLAO|nr:hypothetical protein [Aureibaculum algae]QCX37739.1 hypothetical protein FF125_04555 [Aureibaculum algae]